MFWEFNHNYATPNLFVLKFSCVVCWFLYCKCNWMRLSKRSSEKLDQWSPFSSVQSCQACRERPHVEGKGGIKSNCMKSSSQLSSLGWYFFLSYPLSGSDRCALPKLVVGECLYRLLAPDLLLISSSLIQASSGEEVQSPLKDFVGNICIMFWLSLSVSWALISLFLLVHIKISLCVLRC